MDKLNQRLTLIANLSVVVGIVFLAVELSQNTQAIQAQTRDSITEKQMEYLGWLAASEDLPRLNAKIDASGWDSLTPVERSQWGGYGLGQIREWENSFYQFERGLFTEAEFVARSELWRLLIGGNRGSGYRAVWGIYRGTFAPSFRAEIDAIVAEVGG